MLSEAFSLLTGYAAIARDCDVLCLCVFSDAQVREVLFDNGAGGDAAVDAGIDAATFRPTLDFFR